MMCMLSSRLSNCTLISHTPHWPTLSMSRSSWTANRLPPTRHSVNPVGTCFLGRLPALYFLEHYSGGTGNLGGYSTLVKPLSPCFLPKNTCLSYYLSLLLLSSATKKNRCHPSCRPVPASY